MNIKNGHLAGQSPAFCRPINIHRPAANEHFKCSLSKMGRHKIDTTLDNYELIY